MSQELNLSLLANKVNQDGQLDLSSGSVNALRVLNGGTGLATLTSNALLTGNGTNAVQLISPGASGNILMSNGTSWSSQTPTYGIGVGQSWQDVTSSRVMGTTYTNSTGKPIMLVARASRNGVSTSGIDITINGLTIPVCYGTNSNGGNTAVGSIIIPVGATYVLSVSSESLSSYNIFELR